MVSAMPALRKWLLSAAANFELVWGERVFSCHPSTHLASLCYWAGRPTSVACACVRAHLRCAACNARSGVFSACLKQGTHWCVLHWSARLGRDAAL